MKKPLFFLLCGCAFPFWAKGNIATPTFQSPLKADSTLTPSQPVEKKPIIIHGSVRSDLLFPQTDAVIGTEDTHHGLLSNTAAQFSLTYDRWEAGLRYEYQQQPLPGFEKDFAGHGLPYAYLRGRMGRFDVTLGSYYEQFGSGFILRTYEAPTLGIDSHLRGIRVAVDAGSDVQIKAIAGRQRHYWSTNPANIFGLDGEWTLPHLSFLPSSRLILGASWVAKQEKQDNLSRIITQPGQEYPLRQQLIQPTWVHAFDVRLALHQGRFNALAEYALKGQDPSFDNGYTYGLGSALLVSTSYARRGFVALFQAKRAENMSFRSQRSGSLSPSMLNHLPPFTPQPTYALTTLYPYATQSVPGEWAFQGEISYNLPKRSTLGGRYGTALKGHASQIFALRLNLIAAAQSLSGTASSASSNLMGTDGVQSRGFFAMGSTLYREIGVDLDRRLSHPLHLHLAYLHQCYDKTAIEGKGGFITTHIGIGELRWKASRNLGIRTELQYLHTQQDQGDWASALVEVSAFHKWMLTLADQYNAHVYSASLNRESAVHYLQGFLTYTEGLHRLQLGYGRTRAGYNCAGGVCRYIPAQRGWTLSYNLTF